EAEEHRAEILLQTAALSAQADNADRLIASQRAQLSEQQQRVEAAETRALAAEQQTDHEAGARRAAEADAATAVEARNRAETQLEQAVRAYDEAEHGTREAQARAEGLADVARIAQHSAAETGER